MAMFPRPVRPSRALGDLFSVIGQPQRHQVVIAILAVALTAAMVWAVVEQFRPKEEWKAAEVMYVKQWPKTRTAADVRAQQAIDAPREAAERKKAEAEAAERRRQFDRVAKMMGI